MEGILDLCGLGGEHVQWQKELQHCIVTLFSRIKYYAYTKYIVLIGGQFQTPSTTFKIKCKKKKWYLVTVIYEMSLFK